MNNKKGFTLVELLAVVVILAVILSIAGVSVMKTKKDSDIEAAKNLEKTLKDIALQVYSYEMTMKTSAGGNFYTKYNGLSSSACLYVKSDTLKNSNYLKSDLKVGNTTCSGHIAICKTSEGPSFGSKIKCSGIYGDGNIKSTTSDLTLSN